MNRVLFFLLFHVHFTEEELERMRSECFYCGNWMVVMRFNIGLSIFGRGVFGCFERQTVFRKWNGKKRKRKSLWNIYHVCVYHGTTIYIYNYWFDSILYFNHYDTICIILSIFINCNTIVSILRQFAVNSIILTTSLHQLLYLNNLSIKNDETISN